MAGLEPRTFGFVAQIANHIGNQIANTSYVIFVFYLRFLSHDIHDSQDSRGRGIYHIFLFGCFQTWWLQLVAGTKTIAMYDMEMCILLFA